MGNYSPGRFRKQGREAFEPHCNPNDFNPYLNDSNWYNQFNRQHWLEGWKEAEAAYVEPEEEEEYMVMATYPDELNQEEAGYITLRTINSCHDMPTELEIDGVTYYPKF